MKKYVVQCKSVCFVKTCCKDMFFNKIIFNKKTTVIYMYDTFKVCTCYCNHCRLCCNGTVMKAISNSKIKMCALVVDVYCNYVQFVFNILSHVLSHLLKIVYFQRYLLQSVYIFKLLNFLFSVYLCSLYLQKLPTLCFLK